MRRENLLNTYVCLCCLYRLSDSFAADLWEEAIKQLNKKLQAKIEFRKKELVDLESVVASAEEKKEEFASKRSEKLHQVFGRVVQRLSKFKDIGDSVAAIEPTHLAIPWAAIKLVLQVRAQVISSDLYG